MKPLFQESQRFNQWWLWLIIFFACSFPFIGFVQQIILGKPFGDNPMSNIGLIISLVFSITFMALFYAIQLKTEITRETISFRFVPFMKRTYPFNEIESYEVIHYGFVGGWGIRFGTKYGTVYNIKGTKGLFVKLKNGKTFIIGTQKPQELENVIKNIANAHS